MRAIWAAAISSRLAWCCSTMSSPLQSGQVEKGVKPGMRQSSIGTGTVFFQPQLRHMNVTGGLGNAMKVIL